MSRQQDTNDKKLRRAWAEIDLKAISNNCHFAHEACSAGLIAVVKANAYGHGAIQVCRALEKVGQVEFFGVANTYEANELFQASLETPIFLLGNSLPEERELIVERDWRCSAASLAELKHFDDLAKSKKKKYPLHINIDTGMGRTGFQLNEWNRVLWEQIAQLEHIEIEGICSHMPNADDNLPGTLEQVSKFKDLVEQAQIGGLECGGLHIANSAGVLFYDLTELRWARPGLMLYGSSPARPHNTSTDLVSLTSALELKARVVLVRNVPADTSISYGSTFITDRETTVATVCIGYGDGYLRSLSNAGAEVLIDGQRCPLLGRVTMDQIMVDVSALTIVPEVGTEVVLIGQQGQQSITVNELAKKAGTIPWEIFTGITPRVQRTYIGA